MVEDLVTSGVTQQLIEEEITGRNGISKSLDGFFIASDTDNLFYRAIANSYTMA